MGPEMARAGHARRAWACPRGRGRRPGRGGVGPGGRAGGGARSRTGGGGRGEGGTAPRRTLAHPAAVPTPPPRKRPPGFFTPHSSPKPPDLSRHSTSNNGRGGARGAVRVTPRTPPLDGATRSRPGEARDERRDDERLEGPARGDERLGGTARRDATAPTWAGAARRGAAAVARGQRHERQRGRGRGRRRPSKRRHPSRPGPWAARSNKQNREPCASPPGG